MSSTDRQPAQTASQRPVDIPPPPDQDQWNKAAQQFQLDLLSKVQASASVWSGSITALLGLFGTVALVAGPSDITKIGPNMQDTVFAMTLLAGILAAAAIAQFAKAQGLPSVYSNNWNGDAYREYIVSSASADRTLIRNARRLGVAAATVVFAMGSAVILYVMLKNGK